jgi:hypothetical protein
MTYDKPKRYSHGALRATPDGVYSYATCLLTHLASGTRVYNATKYSPTTSKHQAQVRVQYIPGIPSWSTDNVPTWPNVLVVDNIPRGASAQALIAALKRERA